ncbi:MAG: gfo/Idh/MocA family oxidoreductase, partial [Thermoproteota archaeon]
MRSVRVGVIGCGWFGAAHARVYRAAGADLVAVADMDEGRAKRLGEVYGVNYYSNYRRMLDSEDLDAVSVVVTPQNLAEVAADAMGRGVAVLIEKPMAVSRAQLEELMRAYSNSGVIAMPGFIELFNPGYEKLREIVTSGDVGEILMISGTRLGRFPKRSLAWEIGVALDLAIHEVYVQMHLLG